jgi:hypothetical protein
LQAGGLRLSGGIEGGVGGSGHGVWFGRGVGRDFREIVACSVPS